MNVPIKRELTEQEAKAIKMLAMWEELVDNKRLFGTFLMSEEAYSVCLAASVATPLSVDRDRKTELYSVRFDLVQLSKYISFVARHVGLKVRIDGNVVTHDGITYPIPHKVRPTINHPSK